MTKTKFMTQKPLSLQSEEIRTKQLLEIKVDCSILKIIRLQFHLLELKSQETKK
jgi:hypothetical protein